MTHPPEPHTIHPGHPAGSRKAVAIVGYSNSGKTELICRLLPCLAAWGLRVTVLKHSHHSDISLGDEGKDTWRYRQAGAQTVALAAPGVLQFTWTFPKEPPLKAVLETLAAQAEVVLVEGYKTGPLPKVAVLGPEEGDEAPDYSNLIALVSDTPVKTHLPVFQTHQAEELSRFLHEFLTQA